MRGEEAFSFGFARLPISEVIPETIDQYDPRSPLPYLLLNIWIGMAWISELALRYPSALAGRYSWPFSSPWAGAWAARDRVRGGRTSLNCAGPADAAGGSLRLRDSGADSL
ncbi:MAG: hypothetical protein R6X18_04805 [Chloroflexota bacterium]